MRKLLFVLILVCSTMSSCDTAKQILETYGNTTTTGGLTNTEIVAGLKEALTVGTQRTTSNLSQVDGFFANAAIKILMPEEAKKVESTLRSVGLGNVVDKAVLSMNRAAEEAAKGASGIFLNAVRQMTISDALTILRGGDFAATNYFKGKTADQLTASFKPVIDDALSKVNATKYWTDAISVYNTFSKSKVETDLTAYVTNRALDGIFHQVALEEQKIRENPVARTTDILKKVFGSQLAQQKTNP